MPNASGTRTYKKKISDFQNFTRKKKISIFDYHTSLNKSQAWHIDGATNKKIHMIFIKY